MSNFSFLDQYEKALAEIGKRAESYLHTDASSCFFNIRLFAEKLAKYAAIQNGIPDWEADNLLNLLNLLKQRGIFGVLALELFHGIRKSGNKAVHTGTSEYTEASHHLKMAWKLGVMYHRAVSKDHKFDPPYSEPKIPRDYQRAAQHAQQKLESLEAEKEAIEKELHQRLKKLEEELKSRPEKETKLVQERFYQESNDLKLDEKATRHLIDQQLRDAGWEADTENLTFSKGIRPEKNRFIAIAEWPTDNGPADYAIFCGLNLLALVEAKKKCKDVKSSLEQSKRYARGLKAHGEEKILGNWRDYKAPFLFATNGRAYLEQLKEKSGIWFLDVRLNTNLPRPLVGWYTPEGLTQLLQKVESKATEKLLTESKDYLPLRDYQKDAIDSVEKAIIAGQREILIAMATGTGKTRTCIGLTYRLIKSGRFRRVLFLVDRTALGDQAADAFTELKIEENKSFTQIYNIKDLEEIQVDSDTRIHFSTVQGLIKRVLYPTQNEGASLPVDQYDCIIIDECHRGYTLDKELSDVEFEYRDEQDFISKYRRVIEYFDAVKIGLTATPALHTKEIFGEPVYSYSYREAVIDGFLVDYHDPYRIKTKLSEVGIKWNKGDTIEIYDPKTSSIEKLSNLPDELQMDLGSFNTKVITEEFNRVVCEELANHIEWDGDEKTLIFCARDDHADMVVRLLSEAFVKQQGEVDQEAIKKITDNSDRPKELIKRFKNEKYPSIVVTVDLLTTGIDVPTICNIVFLRRVRSRILYDQMIGRATRLCEEIAKDHFNIFDAVDLYNTLQDYSAMKPVTANPSVTLEELTTKLKESSKEATKQHIIDQLIAKLNARKRRLKGNKLEEFKVIMAGNEPAEVIDTLKSSSTNIEPKWMERFEQLAKWLDRERLGENKMFISDHDDEFVGVEQGFSGNQRPEDYIEGFSKFVKEHMNRIQALKIIAQRPKDLTRQDLRELKIKLDEHGFTEKRLRDAYKKLTNEDVAASIIGYIRRASLGDPLVSFELRLEKGVARLKQKHEFNTNQLKWIDRIAKQIRIELVVDKEALDRGALGQFGGYKRASKIFDGEIENILSELQDSIWQVAEAG